MNAPNNNPPTTVLVQEINQEELIVPIATPFALLDEADVLLDGLGLGSFDPFDPGPESPAFPESTTAVKTCPANVIGRPAGLSVSVIASPP